MHCTPKRFSECHLKYEKLGKTNILYDKMLNYDILVDSIYVAMENVYKEFVGILNNTFNEKGYSPCPQKQTLDLNKKQARKKLLRSFGGNETTGSIFMFLFLFAF